MRPLSKLFKAKFRAALQKTELFKQVPYQLWQAAWVVHSQAVGNGQAALKYLAPYIFRVALSNKRSVKLAGLAHGLASFGYTFSYLGFDRLQFPDPTWAKLLYGERLLGLKFQIELTGLVQLGLCGGLRLGL